MMWLLLTFLIVFEISAEPCNRRQTDYGAVCVCSSSFCDASPPLQQLSEDDFQIYQTSEDNLGYHSSEGVFSRTSLDDSADFSVRVNANSTFQIIVGFGSSFTDSAGQNVLSLPDDAQKNFIQANFGEDGNRYSLCRVPIGASDFSPRPYTYDDNDDAEDPTLSKFSLQEEDLTYKIPLILNAKEVRGENELQLIASAWSAPAWMKTNNKISNIGFLKEEYYQTWADYYVKFIDAYREQGVDFWGVTTQNEPRTGFRLTNFPGMAWWPSQMSSWIGNNFGPTIKNTNSTSHLKILAGDDQKLFLPIIKDFILNDTLVSKYIDGVALHWYDDIITPPKFLEDAQSNKEGWVIINTEACNGYLYTVHLEKAVELGSWKRAERYIKSILDDLDYGANGWVDWNMALDLTGGPLYINNNVDSPIIVNATAGEFYKQPMYYALGHFSKFLSPGAVRVESEVVKPNEDVRSISFLRVDGRIANIIWNRSERDLTVQIEYSGKFASIVSKAKSINTVLYMK